MDNNNLNIKTIPVCRTCMEEIINTSCFHLDFTQVDSEPTIGQKLSNCIPELDLSIVPNAVICDKCADTINSLYLFKKECLRLEMQIHEYIRKLHHTNNVIDLAAVMQFHQLHPNNLSAELTTEALEKTENYKNESTTFCDNYVFNETEENTATGTFKKTENYKNEEKTTSFCETERYTEIANTEYLTSLQMVDRECVIFNSFEDFINSDKSETENSDTHGDSNIVQGCLPQIAEYPDSCIQNLNKPDIYYQCFTCGHKTKCKLKLIRHLKSHTTYKKLYRKKMSSRSRKTLPCWYRCDLCNYSTKQKCLFSFHNRMHLTKKYYQHILKNRPILVNPSTNTITFGKKGSKDKIKCRSKSLESKHHSNACDDIKLATDTNIILKPFKYWICEICGYSNTNKLYNLKAHLLTHTGEKPFKCSVCEYSCKQKSNLKSHMLTHTGGKLLKCSVCEYSCNHKQHLKYHILTHTGEKPFKCSVCEYSCKKKSNFKIHMLTHTGEKPFKCSVCEYSCNQKNNLKSHMLTHKSAKPFKCSVCEYSCKKKGNLKSHMLTHTGEKLFKCSVCEYSCNHKQHLKYHILTHTGEKPFKCAVCEYSCNQKNNLKSHILTHKVQNHLSAQFVNTVVITK